MLHSVPTSDINCCLEVWETFNLRHQQGFSYRCRLLNHIRETFELMVDFVVFMWILQIFAVQMFIHS